MARPRINFSRQRRKRGDFSDQSGDGATFQTKTETASFFRPRWRRRDQDYIPRDKGGNDATFQTKAETARLFRPRRKRRDFSDQGGDGATFQTKAKTERLSRPRRLGLKSRAAFAFVMKSAPIPPWLDSRAVSTLVWKAAPSPPWSRHPRLGRESRAVSALIWKFAPSPPWSRRGLRRIRIQTQIAYMNKLKHMNI